MVIMVILWLTKNLHGIGTTTVTFLGIIFILFSGAASWESMIKNHKAWDALIWLGGLLTLATSLKRFRIYIVVYDLPSKHTNKFYAVDDLYFDCNNLFLFNVFIFNVNGTYCCFSKCDDALSL